MFESRLRLAQFIGKHSTPARDFAQREPMAFLKIPQILSLQRALGDRAPLLSP